MKLTTKLFGLTAIIAVIVFLTLPLAGCQDDDGGVKADTALNGTWVENETDMEVKYKNGSFESTEQAKGTYTTSGGKITITITHLHGDQFGGPFGLQYYSKSEMKTAYQTYYSGYLTDAH